MSKSLPTSSAIELKTAAPSPQPDPRLSVEALYNTGQYQNALDLISNLQTQKPADLLWLEKQRGIVLVTMGWMAVKANQCDQAFHFFEQIKMENSDAVKGEAVCFFKNKDFLNAERKLKTYLTTAPKDQEAKDLLKIIQEELKEEDPNVYQQETTQNFLIRFPRGFFYVDQIISILENSLADLETTFEMQKSQNSILVVIYDQKNFSALLGDKPGWIDGMFDGRIRVPLSAAKKSQDTELEKLKVTLKHELVHAFFDDILRPKNLKMPIWLNEGLAQYFSCLKSFCDGFQFSASPGDFLSLNKLEKPFVQFSSSEASMAYNQSLYLVRKQLKENPNDGFFGSLLKAVLTNDKDLNIWTSWHENASSAWTRRVIY